MSKIAIAARTPTRCLPVAALIRDFTRQGLSSVLERMAAGPAGVFYTAELFLNDHVERDAQITHLLDVMLAHGIEPVIYELPYDACWPAPAGHGAQHAEISPAVVRAMLADARERFRQETGPAT